MMTTLDLSALATLSVLLEERHVTRAARRLGITQSTMSHRLAQLRASLQDPLLVRGPSGLVPSERASRMEAPLAEALARLDAIVHEEAPVSLARVERSITLVLPDLLAPALPELRERLAQDAPRIQLRVRQLDASFEGILANETGSFAVTPAHLAALGLRSRSLGRIHFGVAGRRGHPAFRRWSLAAWLGAPHVTVDVGRGVPNPIDVVCRERGYERRVELVVPSFLTGLVTVAESNLLMNVPAVLATRIVRKLGLVVREPPVVLPSTRLLLLWHERGHAEAELVLVRKWLVDFFGRRLQRKRRA